jgi:hypothetical protein
MGRTLRRTSQGVSIATPADTVSGMREIESIEDLDVVLKEETGSLTGLRLQGLDLTARADQLLGYTGHGGVLLGCRAPAALLDHTSLPTSRSTSETRCARTRC